MSHEADAGVAVLRDIWSAQARGAEELESQFRPVKHCKAMRHVGTEPVDDDLRAAWRDRLDREGKRRDGARSLGERLRDGEQAPGRQPDGEQAGDTAGRA